MSCIATWLCSDQILDIFETDLVQMVWRAYAAIMAQSVMLNVADAFV